MTYPYQDKSEGDVQAQVPLSRRDLQLAHPRQLVNSIYFASISGVYYAKTVNLYVTFNEVRHN